MVRNKIPLQPIGTAPGSGIREGATTAEIASWVEDALEGVIGFLVREHPRGPVPTGPEALTATAKSDAVVLEWRSDVVGSTVDFFAVYRAAAGTSGAPITPDFDDAQRIAVTPSGRVGRQLPFGSVFTYADLDFSSADRTAGQRFKYWVSEIDNEFRESRPVPAAAIVTVPAASGGGITVRKNSGADVGTRPRVNLIEGSNITLTVLDDAGGNEVDVTIAAAGGGGGAAATTVEPNLGSGAAVSGKFTITDGAISGTSKVLCWQAPGPYTGKGTRADEAQMQPVKVTAVAPAAGTAVVYWEAEGGYVPLLPADAGVGPAPAAGVTGLRAGQNLTTRVPAVNQENQRIRQGYVGGVKRIGKARGSVKFSYVVFA